MIWFLGGVCFGGFWGGFPGGVDFRFGFWCVWASGVSCSFGVFGVRFVLGF